MNEWNYKAELFKHLSSMQYIESKYVNSLKVNILLLFEKKKQHSCSWPEQPAITTAVKEVATTIDYSATIQHLNSIGGLPSGRARGMHGTRISVVPHLAIQLKSIAAKLIKVYQMKKVKLL